MGCFSPGGEAEKQVGGRAGGRGGGRAGGRGGGCARRLQRCKRVRKQRDVNARRAQRGDQNRRLRLPRPRPRRQKRRLQEEKVPMSRLPSLKGSRHERMPGVAGRNRTESPLLPLGTAWPGSKAGDACQLFLCAALLYFL
ncbi:tumor suppressor candidate gene 1 protein homolog [Penaeus japonicus]|uniref:tumor suppressor candidate gene 1 protein homolog n=1 Tax=Penaeus japonicus TaxID=27405 RepID=UPI001C7137EB|nr:tumor suppressor candidate gene 1 protein homolog [Penaeus japonicus]